MMFLIKISCRIVLFVCDSKAGAAGYVTVKVWINNKSSLFSF